MSKNSKEKAKIYNATYRAKNPYDPKKRREIYIRDREKEIRRATEYYHLDIEKNREIGRIRVSNGHRKKKDLLAGRPRPTNCECCGIVCNVVFDHDHDTGKFRGWICNRCNRVLGFVQDSKDVLSALIAFLESHPKDE